MKRMINRILLIIVKLSRIVGTKTYMRLYTNYLKSNGVAIKKYHGEGFFAPDVLFDSYDYSQISIGEGTTIATGTIILTHDFSIRKAMCSAGYNPDNLHYVIKKSVEIGNNVFIGARSTILPGTKINNNVIIAAGSVVKGEVPQNTVWGGVPAKLLCTVEEYAKRHHDLNDYTVVR